MFFIITYLNICIERGGDLLMGSLIEFNDTLQITKAQGFPAELYYKRHDVNPFTAQDFEGRVFEFKDKPGIRVYHVPPVRVFLVENRDGKWLYWGLIHILEVTHNYARNTTSGKFKIVYIFTPDQVRQAHQLIDRDPITDFFA